MSDFEARLTTLLDDVAGSIQPRSDFDAVGSHRAGLAPDVPSIGRGRPFRRGIAAAAASVLVLGGLAAAAYSSDDGDPDLVASATSLTEPTTVDTTPTETSVPEVEPTVASTDAPAKAEPSTTVKYSAELGEASLDDDPVAQVIHGTAPPKERVTAKSDFGVADAVAGPSGTWRLVLVLENVPSPAVVPVQVSFDGSPKVFDFAVEVPGPPETTTVPTSEPEPAPAPPPKPQPEPAPKPQPEPTPAPKPAPQPVEFTAVLGTSYREASPMKQMFHGTATPGSTVLATSAYGHATAVAGAQGAWELALKMYDVPAPSSVLITVSAEGSANTFDFWVERPAPAPKPAPQTKPFTAEVSEIYFEGELTKVILHGTGHPGSGVLASSEFGAEDARVNDGGGWEIWLKSWNVPAGHEFVVRVTNNASDSVFEFVVHQPEAEPEPAHVEFTANAALTESAANPPVNEYWGGSTAGAKITLSSPYGAKYVEANASGTWDARMEFPDAPVGVTFEVVVTSSKSETTYTFPFTRVE